MAMKRPIWMLVGALMVSAVLTGPPGVRAGEPAAGSASEVIDPDSLYVRFKVRVFGLISVVGRFERLLGRFLNDPQGDTTGVSMRIEAASVTTDDAWRDAYLRGPTFFASDRYPHIMFSGSCLRRGDDGVLRLVGDLRIRGRSRPVVFEFEPVDAVQADDTGPYRAKAVIRRSEFGLDAMQHVISDEVEIIVAMRDGGADTGIAP
jgi:polyisoprenoid-binding protein YceI